MQQLKANTAIDVLIGPFVDDTTGKDAETALTLSQADIKLSKNGQTLAQKSDVTAAAHDANGYYNCELDATDTNTEGCLVLIVHETGALPVRHEYMVLSEAAYDSLYAVKDTGFMDVNVKEWNAVALATTNPLPTVAAGAAGGLPDDTDANGRVRIVDGTGAGELDTASGAVTVGSIAANAITAASINASALDNKGNWNVGKTGYSLTVGTGLGDQTANITGTIDTVTDLTNLPAITANWLTAAGTHADFTTEVVAGMNNLAVTDLLSGGVALNTTGGALDTVTDLTTKTGFELSATGITAIWHQALTSITTASTIGKLLKDNIDAAITSAATAIGFATETKQDAQDLIITEARLAELDAANLPTDIAATATPAEVATELATYDGPTHDELVALFQLALRSDTAIATDRSADLTLINANEGTGAGDYDQSDDSLEAIRVRGDAAWAGAGGTNPWTIASGTLGATGNSTTTLHLDGLTQGNDELNDYLLIITDVSTGEVHSRWIDDWVLSTELATVTLLPFTPELSVDTYAIVGMQRSSGGGDATAASQTTIINHLTDVKGATWDSTNSLEAISDDVGTAQNDLDTLTGTDGVTLATAQANYAPNTVVPPTAVQIRTEIDSNSTEIATLIGVLGALTDAAVDGNPTSTDTVMAYIKQLINILVGTAGVTTMPASAAPGNGVSLTEMIRAIYDDTNEIQGDLVDAGRIDALIDSIITSLTSTGVTLSAAQMNQIADHVHRRTLANIRASSDGDSVVFRSNLGAMSKLVNRVGVSGTDLLVRTEDDTTTFGTQAITTDAAAEPITDLNTT